MNVFILCLQCEWSESEHPRNVDELGEIIDFFLGGSGDIVQIFCFVIRFILPHRSKFRFSFLFPCFMLLVAPLHHNTIFRTFASRIPTNVSASSLSLLSSSYIHPSIHAIISILATMVVLVNTIIIIENDDDDDDDDVLSMSSLSSSSSS
jgi:hypothetical protein